MQINHMVVFGKSNLGFLPALKLLTFQPKILIIIRLMVAYFLNSISMIIKQEGK